ncbi:hypothetical protein [Kocuria sp. cx-455]|uniref:hypothetical protein n=1 Tax=Kocuria sp. cx-455 TaxID=2771377 RepID=UPI003D70E6B3
MYGESYHAVFDDPQQQGVSGAYLSNRQEVCAGGVVRAVVHEDGAWFVHIDRDAARTGQLCRNPVFRWEFGRVPVSVCHANDATAVLSRRHETLTANTLLGTKRPGG